MIVPIAIDFPVFNAKLIPQLQAAWGKQLWKDKCTIPSLGKLSANMQFQHTWQLSVWEVQCVDEQHSARTQLTWASCLYERSSVYTSSMKPAHNLPEWAVCVWGPLCTRAAWNPHTTYLRELSVCDVHCVHEQHGARTHLAGHGNNIGHVIHFSTPHLGNAVKFSQCW